MSSKNPIFSHQKEVVLALSEFFETISVFTTDSGSEPLPKNVELFHIPWSFRPPLGIFSQFSRPYTRFSLGTDLQ